MQNKKIFRKTNEVFVTRRLRQRKIIMDGSKEIKKEKKKLESVNMWDKNQYSVYKTIIISMEFKIYV